MHKILLVTRNFPPLKGGMERLLYHAHQELCGHYRVAMVGPAECGDYLEPDTLRFTCPPGPPAQFLVQCQWLAFKMAKTFQPDLIISGSGLTALAARFAAARFRAPVACFVHGLDLVVRNGFYRMVFLPAIRACDRVIVNSRNTASLAINAGIDRTRIRILHPGVHIPEQNAPPTASLFRDTINAGSRPILLSVGRLTKRKGIAQFIDHCLPEIVDRVPEVLYVVIGDEPREALKGGDGMLETILGTIRGRRLHENVRIIRDADDHRLWQAYSASRLFIFPVIEKPGDVEGFGMVAVEAAAHGLPTAAFATGGIVDAVKEGVSGYLVPTGDYASLTKVVLDHLTSPRTGVQRGSCIEFSRTFSWDLFGEQLRSICSDLTSLESKGAQSFPIPSDQGPRGIHRRGTSGVVLGKIPE